MKKLFLAACAALTAVACGGPTPPGDGGNRGTIPIVCDGADCAIADIIVSRPALVQVTNVDLSIDYMSLDQNVDPANFFAGTWPLSLVEGEYLVCAFADGVEPVCDQQETPAGAHTRFDCRFEEDRAEKKAVRVRHTELGVPVALTLDGTDAELDADLAVLVPMDGDTHIVSARATGFVANERPVDTSQTVPDEIDKISLGYDMGRRVCTETEGPFRGQTFTVEMQTGADGVKIVLLVGPAPIEGMSMNYQDEFGNRVEGGVIEGGNAIDYTVYPNDGSPPTHAHDSCPQ